MEGKALRAETVVNEPNDLGCQRLSPTSPTSRPRPWAANRRMLEVQRVGQDCAISTPLMERVALPSVEEGQRAPGLRFGNPRVMALAGALCALVHAVVGSIGAAVPGELAARRPLHQRANDL